MLWKRQKLRSTPPAVLNCRASGLLRSISARRLDNITPICPSCGIRQALSAAGIDADAQNSIVSLIEEKEAEYEGHAVVN